MKIDFAPNDRGLLAPVYDNALIPGFETMSHIYGFERGTNQRADVITQTLDGADVNRMWSEFQQTVALWNRDRSALVNLLTYPVIDVVERVRYPVGEDFEEASEFGEPKGIRLGPAFSMGFDFKWYDLAIRYTWMFLAENTQAQVEALNNTAIESDNRLLFTRVLRRIFNPTTSVATINEQAVNAYSFYNADGMVPPTWKTYSHDGNHTHYLVSGGVTVDPVDLQDMENHLYHHGYGIQNGTKMVLLVNRQEGLTIRGFKRGTASAIYDFIPNNDSGGSFILPSGQVVGATPGSTVPGEIGTYGAWHVVEEDMLPAGYMFGFATGGERSLTNPVGIREHANPAMRGLRLLPGPRDGYPLVDSFYQHGLGTGVRHRGSGVIMQVKASGTYDIPTAYA